MKKKFLYVFLLCFNSYYLLSQNNNQLNTYPEPPIEIGIDRHNNDYTVRVRSLNGIWKNLYEYKTYVNSGASREVFQQSSFVMFDFSGTIEIEITSNWTNIKSVLIRPISENISYTKTGNVVKFYLSEPKQLSFEINGNRHRNLHIFANDIEVPPPPASVTKRFRNDIINVVQNNADEPKYVAQDNDVIYFEPGAIVKGGIHIREKSNVKILGRGIIDLQHMDKRYTSDPMPDYKSIIGISIQKSDNIIIDGPVINDPQHYCVEITESENININNLKMFSRVLWGDGIDIVGSNNINIDNCFIRTCDDAIAIYSTRIRSWTYQIKNTYNITVDNTILYADAAHPIEIGFHGSNNTQEGGNKIYRLQFNNIDILEHDEHHEEYQGVIAINCADENICRDIYFRNINIEDFSKGRLFNIEVEQSGVGAAVGNGLKIRNIVFDNVTYNGSGEYPSKINGINCDRYVDGVHFHDLKINGKIIKKLDDYKIVFVEGFQTNSRAYNITFQEKNNFSTSLTDGYYRIKNKSTGKYLTYEDVYFKSSAQILITPAINYQIWHINRIPGTGHYLIKSSLNGKYLKSTDELYLPGLCNSRYLFGEILDGSTIQEWKIVGNNLTGHTINNAYSRGYLTDANFPNNLVLATPKTSSNYQKWELIPALPVKLYMKEVSEEFEDDIGIYPNPFTDKLNIDYYGKYDNLSITIYDLSGKEVFNQLAISNQIDLSGLLRGGYILILRDGDSTVLKKMIVKKL